MSCSEDELCPVYLELSGVDSSGAKFFVSGNLHAGTVTLWSILLTSDDAGHSWTEPYDRLRGAVLDQVQFPDFATGFVSGHTAGTLARDPFFLRTSDGGKSWSRLSILEDGAVGLIERYHFDSATRGVVLVDRGRTGAGRYATFETQNGGDSWTIKESFAVRPPRAARAPIASTRVVADAPSKSFRVERREGALWRTAAAFSLAAGVCRPTIRTAPSEQPRDPNTPAESRPPEDQATSGRVH